MGSCKVTFHIKQKSGAPAPFATVDVMKIRKMLFFEYEEYVGGATATFGGDVTLLLDVNFKYHFIFKWIDSLKKLKRRDDWINIVSCPYEASIVMPL